MEKREPIQVDEGVIAAAERARTGANSHAIGETISIYRNWCARGVWLNARNYRYSLILLTKGTTTNAREAWRMASDYFFNVRKEEVRAQGTWHKDWDEFLGVSPDRA